MNSSGGAQHDFRREIVFAFLLALACYVAWLLREELLLLYVSALFAVVLTPLVRATAQFSIGGWRPFKGAAIFFLLLGVAVLLTVFGFLALPPVINDLQEFGREMPARLPGILLALKNIPLRSTWIRRTRFRGCRILPAMRPRHCCFRLETGRASCSMW